MAGRKRVLTPDLVDELAANLAAHPTVEEACTASGLSPRSVRRWRAEEEPFRCPLLPEALSQWVAHRPSLFRAEPGQQGIQAPAWVKRL